MDRKIDAVTKSEMGEEFMAEQGSVFIVMGVSGVGKTTVALGLAGAMDGAFLEADDFHSAENVAHMAKGNPLTDDMRWPWLTTLCAAIAEKRQSSAGAPIFVTCSALKKSYRAFILDLLPDARFVYLHAEPDVIRDRMAARKNHYMPLSLLDSQLDALEDPRSEANCLTVEATHATPDVIERALDLIKTAIKG